MDPVDVTEHFEMDDFGTFGWEIYYISSLVAGILALTSTSYPVMNAFAKGTVFIFFLVVGVKQIAKISPSTSESKFRASLNIITEFLIFFSVLYFSLVTAEYAYSLFVPWVPFNLTLESILLALMLIIPITVIVVLDILFKDIMSYYSLKLYNAIVTDGNSLTDPLAKLAKEGAEASSKDFVEASMELEESLTGIRLFLAYLLILAVVVAFSFVPYLMLGDVFVTVAFVAACYLAKGMITLPFYLYGESDYLELKELGYRKYINAAIPILGLIFILSL